MNLLYVAATRLRDITLEVVRMHVPEVADLRLAMARGPFRPGNWNVEWLDVPAEHYGAAREIADELEAKRHWIMVPDDHALDGQVYGREEAR